VTSRPEIVALGAIQLSSELAGRGARSTRGHIRQQPEHRPSRGTALSGSSTRASSASLRRFVNYVEDHTGTPARDGRLQTLRKQAVECDPSIRVVAEQQLLKPHPGGHRFPNRFRFSLQAERCGAALEARPPGLQRARMLAACVSPDSRLLSKAGNPSFVWGSGGAASASPPEVSCLRHFRRTSINQASEAADARGLQEKGDQRDQRRAPKASMTVLSARGKPQL